MKRAVVVSVLSAVGMAWLLAYKPGAPSLGGVALVSPSDLPASPSPVASGVPTPSATANPTPSATTSGSFVGADVTNRFGDVQVKVVIANGQITDVVALVLPKDRSYSAYVSSVAGPMLRQEAITAQSAKIDIISGATYTSQSYAQSLESALVQAHRG